MMSNRRPGTESGSLRNPSVAGPTRSFIEERRSIGDSGHASAQRTFCEPHAHGLEYWKSISHVPMIRSILRCVRPARTSRSDVSKSRTRLATRLQSSA
jgi:hypothetical protein